MQKTRIALGAALLGIGLAACSQKVTPPPAPVVTTETKAIDRGVEQTTTVTVTAKVKSIDQKTRMVTLLGPDGDEMTFRVSDAVKNLPQVRKGDDVIATAYESIAIQLRKKGDGPGPGVTSTSELATAKPGEMPAAVDTSQLTITGKIVGVDKAKQHVTIEGPKGKRVQVKVKDPARLAEVKVGDLVDVTYTEAVAIAVEKPAKK